MRLNALLDYLLVKEVVTDAVRGHNNYIVVLHLMIIRENLVLEVFEFIANAALIGTTEELVMLFHRSKALLQNGSSISLNLRAK